MTMQLWPPQNTAHVLPAFLEMRRCTARKVFHSMDSSGKMPVPSRAWLKHDQG